MMKKNITIYGNHQFFLELTRDFLEANGFSKLPPINLVSSNQELEQVDVAKKIALVAGIFSITTILACVYLLFKVLA